MLAHVFDMSTTAATAAAAAAAAHSMDLPSACISCSTSLRRVKSHCECLLSDCWLQAARTRGTAGISLPASRPSVLWQQVSLTITQR